MPFRREYVYLSFVDLMMKLHFCASSMRLTFQTNLQPQRNVCSPSSRYHWFLVILPVTKNNYNASLES